jgi:penicillin-binding protein 1A
MLRDDLAPPYAADVPAGEPPFPPQEPAERPSRRRWWKRGFYLLGAAFVLLLFWLVLTAPLSKSLQPIAPPSITLLSSDGNPIARRGAVTDRPVDAATLPEHVTGAFLAIEDRRFYDHLGVDPRAIARAAWRNAQAGGVREGGSTITQQLAKLVFLSSDRTAGRKIQEMILALWLEAWLSKDEILSRYLSSAYFGDNVYGLRAAAQHYFSRDPEDLTVGQAAMLAGLMQAPSRLAPTRNLDGARDRAETVVAAMVDAGVLTQVEADDVTPARLKVRRVKSVPSGTYFADWIFPRARARADNAYGEQTIVTTLDDRLQRLAVDAVRRAPLGGAQVALVAMRPNGEVVAMIGGKSYKASAFNRATQAKRQPGSTFKLFVYLAALRSGMDPESIVLDEPVTIDDWTPRNSGGRYRGEITLRKAFARSSNVAAVRLQEEVGRDEVIKAARDLGITTPLSPEPSLALGTAGVPLIEMTAAYAAVAGGRFPVRPYGLPADGERGVVDSVRTSFRSFREGSTLPMLRDLLHAAANEGTGRAAALRIDTFGKTGTSQDSRDAIFIGFAGDLVTAVWIGNDDNSPLKGIEGGGLPARIWRDFMSRAVGGGAPARRAAPRPEPVEQERAEPLPDTEVLVPIGDSDLSIGIGIDANGVRISAEPLPAPPSEPVTITPPPPVAAPRTDPPEGEEPL